MSSVQMKFLWQVTTVKKKSSDSEWICTDDGEEDREEISSCGSSSEEEMDDQPCSSASANYCTSFPKPKRGEQHLLQIMLVEQLRITLFDKVLDQQGLQNLSAQK